MTINHDVYRCLVSDVTMIPDIQKLRRFDETVGFLSGEDGHKTDQHIDSLEVEIDPKPTWNSTFWKIFTAGSPENTPYTPGNPENHFANSPFSGSSC